MWPQAYCCARLATIRLVVLAPRTRYGRKCQVADGCAPQGTRLAYEHEISDTNIWRAALDQDHRAGEPERIIASSRDDLNGHYTPDGKNVLFVSERSGYPEIWISEADGANPRMISALSGPRVFGPRLSPDGRTILFDMFDVNADGYRQVFVMAANGGPPRRLTSDRSNFFNCTWSRNGKWIYYFDSTIRPVQIARIPDGGGPKVHVTHNGGAMALESPDGRYLYYSKRPSSGLWRMPLPDGQETRVDLDASETGWDVAPDGIYLLRKTSIDFLSFATQRLSPAAQGIADEYHDVHEISVSPDGRSLLYTRHDRYETTIQVVEGFR